MPFKNLQLEEYSLPTIPKELVELQRVAYNVYWAARPECAELFRRVNPDLWERGAGPVRMLREGDSLRALAADAAYVEAVVKAAKDLDAYLAGESDAWYPQIASKTHALNGPVAYFCAEYAFHESWNQYAGGLGILAGDHCKEASDLALPFVAVGLFYRRGFFKQMVDWEGRQEHLYPVYSEDDCPVRRVLDPKTGKPLLLSVDFPGRAVKIAVWLVAVGRAPLLLMDTDLPENAEEDRLITSQLYVNWRNMRAHQEIVLGVGGVRMLRALGMEPGCFHMNEGHSAFLVLERLREAVAGGASFETARKSVAAKSVLTIHTPVPEGNERFAAPLIGSLLEPVLNGVAIEPKKILELGLGVDADPRVFDMTAFALRHSTEANGVSVLHGHTADKTWKKVTTKPVLGVTNGVHMPTWIGGPMKRVFVNLGANLDGKTSVALGGAGADGRARWEGVLRADNEAIWHAHLSQKNALVEFAKRRLFVELARHGDGPAEIRALMDAINPDAFLIGFARRFATYKRASLLFTDPKRLAAMLGDPKRPVQVLFAGKSHPSDRGGQALIGKVYKATNSPRFKGRTFLLEDYDMRVGRHMTQGVDMWLNNPRRPLEASGTSGMKAAANGAPNTSILDGWWDEACDERAGTRNGFSIGTRKTHKDPAVQDAADAASLYEVLEKRVIPLYFDRDRNGVPQGWVELMKRAIASSLHAYSTARMIDDYLTTMYSVADRA